MSSVIAENDPFNIIKNNRYVGGRIRMFYEKHGYVPGIFHPYGLQDTSQIACTLCCDCGAPGHASNMMVITRERID